MADQTFDELNANEVLAKVEAGELAAEQAIEIEQNGKNRKTLVDALQKLAGKGGAGSDNSDDKEPSQSKFKLITNIKHNNTRYQAGEEIELNEEEQKHFQKLGLIKGE